MEDMYLIFDRDIKVTNKGRPHQILVEEPNIGILAMVEILDLKAKFNRYILGWMGKP